MIIMKRYFLILVALFFSVVGMAQKKDEEAVIAKQEKQTAQVAKAVQALAKAMIDADSILLPQLVSDRLSYGHSSGHVDDKKTFVEKIVSGKSDFVTIDLQEQTIDVKNGLAIVRHTLNATTNDGGKPGEVHLKVLLIWAKEKEGWKLVARQAVKIS